jgi:hypothetical protein
LHDCKHQRLSFRITFNHSSNIMNPLRLTLSILISLTLVQCTTLTPEQKAGINKVVVANYLEPKVTRYKVGVTAFGNKELGTTNLPALERGITEVLQDELKPRFRSVIYDRGSVPLTKPDLLMGRTNAGQFAMSLGQKHRADAVLLISGYRYYPYGVPSYLSAEGHGLWYDAFGNAKANCYASVQFLDAKTGEPLAVYPSVREEPWRKLPYEENWNSHTDVEKELLIGEMKKAFQIRLGDFMKGIGY